MLNLLTNRPTGGVALALLASSLHFNPPRHDKSFREHANEFDFLGLILLLGGVVCLLLGFNQSETGCKQYAIYSTSTLTTIQEVHLLQYHY